MAYESRLSTVRQTEETNRQLMTSLSHDVRTPLTTLIGYLDAAHKGLVTGKDRDDYIETARRKAHDLKEYIDVLFDWFKLNSNEFALELQSVEAAEPVSYTHLDVYKRQDIHHIFKRFYRSRFSKDTQGIGLGLPLAKAIIEAHGGLIEVESELGIGTSFIMNFPIPTKL